MNNKKLGNEFEKEVVKLLRSYGWWVHFMSPDKGGAQPFDIIAVKNGRAIAIDCKTCVAKNFSINRLEDNQVFAFEYWLACGNEMPMIVVKHDDNIYVIPYDVLSAQKNVKLDELNDKYSKKLLT